MAVFQFHQCYQVDPCEIDVSACVACGMFWLNRRVRVKFCSSWKVHLVTCWTLENGMNTVIPQTYQKLYVPQRCYLLSVYFDPRTKSCFNLVESHLRVKAAHPGPISLRSTYLQEAAVWYVALKEMAQGCSALELHGVDLVPVTG